MLSSRPSTSGHASRMCWSVTGRGATGPAGDRGAAASAAAAPAGRSSGSGGDVAGVAAAGSALAGVAAGRRCGAPARAAAGGACAARRRQPTAQRPRGDRAAPRASTRATISSSWSRGEVAPVMSSSVGDHEVGGAREPRRAEGVGLARHARELLGGDAAQHRRSALTGRADDDEVAQALEQVVDEAARILAGLHDPVDRGEGGRGIARGEGVDDLVEQLGVRVAEERDRALVAHDGRACRRTRR